MSFTVVVLPAARSDLLRLGEFVGQHSPALALRVQDMLIEALSSLREMPDRGVKIGADDGRQIMIRFGAGGYVVQYQVTADIVMVTRIFHTREDR